MRGVWAGIVLIAGITACVESAPWPEEEMDARNFPKESTGWVEAWSPGTCGDNVVNAPGTPTIEDCDGVNLAGETCNSLGYEGGELACHSTCIFNTLGCEGGYCGNGHVDPGETCDVSISQGNPRVVCLEPGCDTRQCNALCQLTDAGRCRDGIVQAPSEQCDGERFAPGVTSWFPFNTYDLETLGCTNCRIDLSEATPAVCGNGVLERDEECEPGVRSTWDLPGSQRFECVDCRLQDDPSFCGDGVVDRRWYEDCEGSGGVVPCRYQPDPDETIYIPCRDCLLRRSQCPDEPRPIPNMDAGSAAEDAADTPDSSLDAEDVDNVQSGGEPDTSVDVLPDAGAPSSSGTSESSGCAAAGGMPGAGASVLGLVLLFARRRRAA